MNILKSVTLIMVFLLNLAPAAGQVNPFERVTISAAKAGQNLLVNMGIPLSSVAAQTNNPDELLDAIQSALDDYRTAFSLDEAAGCRLEAGDIIRLSPKPDTGGGISAGWEFFCEHNQSLSAIDINLFSLLSTPSIDGLAFPEGQQVIYPDLPKLVFE